MGHRLCTILGWWRCIFIVLQDRPCSSPRDLAAPTFDNVLVEYGNKHKHNNGSYNSTNDQPRIYTRSEGGALHNLMTQFRDNQCTLSTCCLDLRVLILSMQRRPQELKVPHSVLIAALLLVIQVVEELVMALSSSNAR